MMSLKINEDGLGFTTVSPLQLTYHSIFKCVLLCFVDVHSYVAWSML